MGARVSRRAEPTAKVLKGIRLQVPVLRKDKEGMKHRAFERWRCETSWAQLKALLGSGCGHPRLVTTVSRADKAESLPSMLRLDAPIAPVQQSHAGVHRGGNIRRTTGLCMPCAGRLLRRLRLLLHGARNDGAYHQRRRFKLENVQRCCT